jgi:aromatic-L-amino-acid/L-tryptophan decarboxylase
MRDHILQLESISKLLEPSLDDRKEVRREVIAYTEDFLKKVKDLPAYVTNAGKGEGLLNSPIGENPSSIEECLDLLRHNVDKPGLNPASGGHLGYIPGGGIYFSSLADYMADVFNRYAGVFYASPGAVRMENMLISWLASVLGYPEKSAGNLTSGGSIANLMGIVTARDAKKIRSSNIEKSVIYLSSHAHHSVAKAIRIAGLQECIIREIQLDDRFRIDPANLEALIRTDKKNGLNPFLVIASAGTTDTGAVDPLEKIGSITKEHELWYHIDAAYGGFFMLTEEGKTILKGIETSDSVVIDPHKGLFLPYGLGVVLVKNKEALNASHHYTANYMQDTLQANEELSPADISPELTKHFRGLRLWLPLKLHGTRPFKACLQEKLELAKYFHAEIKKSGFETGPEPELSVVTYRFVPRSGNADDFNLKLQEAVVADGRVFISSTRLNGSVWLRFACLSFRTRLETIDVLLKVLAEKVHKLNPAV